jgi:hypothetical protein
VKYLKKNNLGGILWDKVERGEDEDGEIKRFWLCG